MNLADCKKKKRKDYTFWLQFNDAGHERFYTYLAHHELESVSITIGFIIIIIIIIIVVIISITVTVRQ